MSGPLDRPSPGELIRDLERLGDSARLVRRELESVPWFGEAVAALSATRKLRFSKFLKALDKSYEGLDEDQRHRFREWVASKEGQELLTDFAEATVRTRSHIAITALGVLYGDPDHEAYPLAFRHSACEALVGLTDEQVNVFLGLLDAGRAILRSGKRTSHGSVIVTDSGTWHSGASVQGVNLNLMSLEARLGVDEWVLRARTNQLIVRGLLLPKIDSRLASEDYLDFGFGEESLRFEQLLSRARDIIASSPPD